MIARFIIEILIGFFVFISILLLGTKGYVFLALLAITPVYMRLRKIKTDEREYLTPAGSVLLSARRAKLSVFSHKIRNPAWTCWNIIL